MKPNDLEIFRKSLEASWSSISKDAENQRPKNACLAEISLKAFDDYAKTYQKARANYDNRHYVLPDTLVWHGKDWKSTTKRRITD